MVGKKMVGKITYSYTPVNWDQERFLALGGFTVVFLNYNKARFIEKSVASALDQDYPLLEMFFMDDASTDGSGDVMEDIVRQYDGRHKVTVVRNTENQNITGQWNIVAKLATGHWLGMFCGDDWSYPDRVSKAACRIKEYPTLKGICASGIEVGKRDKKVGWSSEKVTECGSTALAQMADGVYPIIGASVFWRRSLFIEDLPYAPLDDLLLRWWLQYLCRNDPSPVWMWDGETNAIKYSYGAGITTTAYEADTGNNKYIDRWLADTRSMRHFARLAARTYATIEAWFRPKIDSKAFIAYARYNRLNSEIKAGNTLRRIVMLPQIVMDVIKASPNKEHANRLITTWLKYFIHELFGLHIAAYTSLLCKKCRFCKV